MKKLALSAVSVLLAALFFGCSIGTPIVPLIPTEPTEARTAKLFQELFFL